MRSREQPKKLFLRYANAFDHKTYQSGEIP